MSGSLPQAPHRRPRPGVDARRLWAGGAASAVVTGLLALTGVLRADRLDLSLGCRDDADGSDL